MEPRMWLVNIREAKGFTQKQVSEMVGIKRPYYTQIELGQRKPSVSVAKQIAATLGFAWTIFFDDNCSEMQQIQLPA